MLLFKFNNRSDTEKISEIKLQLQYTFQISSVFLLILQYSCCLSFFTFLFLFQTNVTAPGTGQPYAWFYNIIPIQFQYRLSIFKNCREHMNSITAGIVACHNRKEVILKKSIIAGNSTYIRSHDNSLQQKEITESRN